MTEPNEPDTAETQGDPSPSRRRMLTTAGFAAMGGAAVAAAGAQVAPMVLGGSVERDEIGRYAHRRSRPGPCELRWCAQTEQRTIALTFDDGPDPEITTKVLASLERHEVTATFFVVASLADTNRALFERILEGGHEVGNHSWEHLRVVDLDQDQTDHEVGAAQRWLAGQMGVPPRWYRPPRGQVTGAVMSAAARNGLDVALWTRRFGVEEPEDCPAFDSVVGGTQPGDFVLIHDGVVESVVKPGSRSAAAKRRRRLRDAGALDELIEDFIAAGWEFDTISGLVDAEARALGAPGSGPADLGAADLGTAGPGTAVPGTRGPQPQGGTQSQGGPQPQAGVVREASSD